VFTDAIAEDEPWVLAAACKPFEFLGLELDPEMNERSPLDTDIATPGSKVRVLLVKSREAWQIARECHALLTPEKSSQGG
jgi:acetate kinase